MINPKGLTSLDTKKNLNLKSNYFTNENFSDEVFPNAFFLEIISFEERFIPAGLG